MTINRNKTRNNTQKIKAFQKQSATAKHNFKKQLAEQEHAAEQERIAEQELAAEQERIAEQELAAEQERITAQELAAEQTKSKEYFSSLSYTELRKEAKASNIENYWRKKRQQLIEELTKTNG